MTFRFRTRTPSAVLLLLLLFIALVGLVGSGASIEAAQRKTHTIMIHGMQFIPATLVVNVGDTVIWKNEDVVPHTATADKKNFDSGGINPGMSWTYVARKRGSYSYICTYHPTMKAALAVH